MMPSANDRHSQSSGYATSAGRWFGFFGAGMLVVTAGVSAAWAASSGTLRLSGYVPARATVAMSHWYSLPVGGGVALKPGRLHLGEVTVLGNNKLFTVDLVSRNKTATGMASLIDEESGSAVPYRLLYDGAEVPFEGGIAKLADSLGNIQPGAGAKALELESPLSVNTSGNYREDLVLVIKAR